MNVGHSPLRTLAAPAGPIDSAGSVLARTYRRGTRLGVHVHREAQLLFAASGVMQVTTPRGRWLVPPERAVWLPPLLEHSVDVIAGIEMRTLYVEPAWLAAHPQAPRLGREFVVEVRPLLRQLVLALFDGRTVLRRDDLLIQLALFELAEAEDATTFMPMPQDPRARRAAEFVLADPASSVELGEITHECGTSARTLTRLFPAETELTFKAWRQRARILAAVAALGAGRASVKQVASRLGFSSVPAFGYAFRQVMGTTPGEFRGRFSR